MPGFAAALHPDIHQFHSSAYRRPSQFADGPVLVVGAGNSGVEIALEAAKSGHGTVLAGRHPGNIPFDIEGTLSRVFMERFVIRFMFHRVFTLHTPIGRRIEPKFRAHGGALIRIKPKQLDAAGIERTGRVTGTEEGRPVLEDGRVLDVKTVVWATGFRHDLSWIDTGPLHDGEPIHERGAVQDRPGLYFVGLHFLYAMSSSMVHGVSRDAEYIAGRIAEDPRTARVTPAGRLAGRDLDPADGRAAQLGRGTERSRSPAASSVSGFLQNAKRSRSRPSSGREKNDEPGTAATPTSRTRSRRGATSSPSPSPRWSP